MASEASNGGTIGRSSTAFCGGAPWRDLPERYGPWRTCYDRFGRWRRDDTWDRLLTYAQTKSDAVGDVVWEVSIDSTVICAHQHAAGARKKGDPGRGGAGTKSGRLTTKLHLACDGVGRPLALVLTPGQRHDSTQLEQVFAAIQVPRSRAGRPRTRPDRLIADKGYRYDRCRRLLRRRGIVHTIAERVDQRMRRARHAGRHPVFDRDTYRHRNVAERCINRLKQWRGLATRSEKRAATNRAMAVIASLMIWLGH